jgi:Ras-related protein Rab-8A
MTEDESIERAFKIFLLGDSSVGKTCLLKRYTDDTFQDVYLSTIGFDYKFKRVTLNNGKKIKVQLWDTAGQERFHTIAKSYYKGAHGILLIYDVTNQKSFENIKKWLAQIKEEASSKVVVILVANKIDCEKRVVSREDGESLAESFGLGFHESSAKNNVNVNESFQDLIEKIYEVYQNTTAKALGKKLNNDSSNDKNNKGCCK